MEDREIVNLYWERNSNAIKETAPSIFGFLSYLFWKKVWLFWQNYAIIIVNVFGGENNARVTNVFVTISFIIA